MEVYRIKDWEAHFENSESRKIRNLRYTLVPNKHDGKGYRRLTIIPNGLQIFGAFVLILEIASKMPTRGVLADEDGPLTISDLAVMTGFKEDDFSKAMEVLVSKPIGWIELANLPACPDEPGESPASSGLKEGKGRELKEHKEGKERETAQTVFQCLSIPNDLVCSEFQERLATWVDHRMKGKKPATTWQDFFQRQVDWIGTYSKSAALEILSTSIRNGWTGLFPPKESNATRKPNSNTGTLNSKTKSTYAIKERLR